MVWLGYDTCIIALDTLGSRAGATVCSGTTTPGMGQLHPTCVSATTGRTVYTVACSIVSLSLCACVCVCLCVCVLCVCVCVCVFVCYNTYGRARACVRVCAFVHCVCVRACVYVCKHLMLPPPQMQLHADAGYDPRSNPYAQPYGPAPVIHTICACPLA